MIYNISSKEIYDILKNDEEIINIYNKIEYMENNEGGWSFHNYEHIKNVTEIAEKILKDLNYDENTIYKCKIACLLHDIGALEGKDEHAKRSYEYVKKLFKDKNWIFEDSDIILDAIKNHSSSFDNKDIITATIILADKLDIKKTRISDSGKKIIGNRQYQHIEDIDINIKDDVITINFITDGMINLKEINEYYFTTKVFKAIESFSNLLNLNYNILLDNKKWCI